MHIAFKFFLETKEDDRGKNVEKSCWLQRVTENLGLQEIVYTSTNINILAIITER